MAYDQQYWPIKSSKQIGRQKSPQQRVLSRLICKCGQCFSVSKIVLKLPNTISAIPSNHRGYYSANSMFMPSTLLANIVGAHCLDLSQYLATSMYDVWS